MNAKMKSCFTPHVIMHSLFGLGLGFIIAALLPGLPLLILGIIACVAAFLFDAMRKG